MILSTATETPPAQQPATKPTTAVAEAPKEAVISFQPLGESETVHLTISRVKQYLCTPTKSGKMPTDEQVMKFMMLCKAQSLNPWVNDAFLVGYDSKDGPQFSLITAHQALLKRAEASPEFLGIESGVVVACKDGSVKDRQGDLVLPGEALVGGWARVHRSDRAIPSYDSLNLKTFNTGYSRWAADPAGQIVKCSEASALRKAFPSTLAAMYCKEEMDRNREIERDHIDAIAVESRPKTERLTERLLQSPSSTLQGTTLAAQQDTVKTETAARESTEKVEDTKTEPAFDPAQAIAMWQTRIDSCKTPDDLDVEYPRFDAVRGELDKATGDAIQATFDLKVKAFLPKK